MVVTSCVTVNWSVSSFLNFMLTMTLSGWMVLVLSIVSPFGSVPRAVHSVHSHGSPFRSPVNPVAESLNV
jgi:hypothetical protein